MSSITDCNLIFVLSGDYSASLAATKEKLWPALVLGWIYWLPMHTLTYSVVPLRYR
jgi:hypothetical protein